MDIFYMIVSLSLVGGSGIAFALAIYTYVKKRRPLMLIVAGAMFCFFLGEIYWLTYLSIEGQRPSGFNVPDLSFIGHYFFLITGELVLFDAQIRKEIGKTAVRFTALAAPFVMVCLSVALILLGRNAFTTIAYFIPTSFFSYYALRDLLVARKSPTASKLTAYYLCCLVYMALVETSYYFTVFNNPIGNGIAMIAAGLMLVAKSVTAMKEAGK